ncbi:hypothetical protein DPEC_G00287570 [Dallia pectoralis]|uniref:Uncharacterized protein n=1 Tax=Dallia pectoralis TaxID=75939 RepID=A0ACC2FKA7_DALPE|nr:hypothetical protein DPEC_G00287570 [Dallia pectoralis]
MPINCHLRPPSRRVTFMTERPVPGAPHSVELLWWRDGKGRTWSRNLGGDKKGTQNMPEDGPLAQSQVTFSLQIHPQLAAVLESRQNNGDMSSLRTARRRTDRKVREEKGRERPKGNLSIPTLKTCRFRATWKRSNEKMATSFLPDSSHFLLVATPSITNGSLR